VKRDDYTHRRPRAGARLSMWIAIVLFFALAVGGQFYVKWSPYYAKVFVAARDHTLGASIVSGNFCERTVFSTRHRVSAPYTVLQRPCLRPRTAERTSRGKSKFPFRLGQRFYPPGRSTDPGIRRAGFCPRHGSGMVLPGDDARHRSRPLAYSSAGCPRNGLANPSRNVELSPTLDSLLIDI
jgi:hypothetical protein